MKPGVQLWHRPYPCRTLCHPCMQGAQKAGDLVAVRACKDQQKQHWLADDMGAHHWARALARWLTDRGRSTYAHSGSFLAACVHLQHAHKSS